MITPRQLTALANGATRFTVPMDPQPPADGRCVFGPISSEGQWLNVVECKHVYIDPPYRPGDRIPLPEEWAFHSVTEGGSLSDYRYCVWVEYQGREVVEFEVNRDVYRLCETLFEAEDSGTSTVWHPASEMPDWAVRKWATVLSCEPCKVGEITAQEAMAEGIKPGFMIALGSRILEEYRAAWESDFPGVPFESWGWTVVVESK